MPKDATKNVDRYKIAGGQLNEFEYQQNQQQTASKKTTNKTKQTADKNTAGVKPRESAKKPASGTTAKKSAGGKASKKSSARKGSKK